MNLLEQVTWEHEHFQTKVDEFQLWLEAVAEKVNACVGRHYSLSPHRRLSVLQVPTAESPPGATGAGLARGGFGVRTYLVGRCWGPQEIPTTTSTDTTGGEAWTLVRNVWGLTAFCRRLSQQGVRKPQAIAARSTLVALKWGTLGHA